jgi:hypothetical protein
MLSNLHYAFKALVVGTYEGLLTRRSHINHQSLNMDKEKFEDTKGGNQDP